MSPTRIRGGRKAKNRDALKKVPEADIGGLYLTCPAQKDHDFPPEIGPHLGPRPDDRSLTSWALTAPVGPFILIM